MTSTTRISVRHAGDHDAEWLAERDRKDAARRSELEARMAASRKADPALAERVDAIMRRR